MCSSHRQLGYENRPGTGTRYLDRCHECARKEAASDRALTAERNQATIEIPGLLATLNLESPKGTIYVEKVAITRFWRNLKRVPGTSLKLWPIGKFKYSVPIYETRSELGGGGYREAEAFMSADERYFSTSGPPLPDPPLGYALETYVTADGQFYSTGASVPPAVPDRDRMIAKRLRSLLDAENLSD